MDSDFWELVQSAEGIIVSPCSNFVLERAKNSFFLSRVRGLIRIFRVTPQHNAYAMCSAPARAGEGRGRKRRKGVHVPWPDCCRGVLVALGVGTIACCTRTVAAGGETKR
jgi:hypothetical protein